MSSFRGALIASLGVLAMAAPTALAHGGQSINYISSITGVAPQARGVTVDILDRDDRLQVTQPGPVGRWSSRATTRSPTCGCTRAAR